MVVVQAGGRVSGRTGKTFGRAGPAAPGGAALSFALALVLGGCGEGGLPGLSGGGVAPATSVELVERDVEAPEVFQITASGLWDGRPSLGGVWVAHPDVTDPERVIIRNRDTGSFVIGALFRRERDNPGPVLQVSSDAADALGMLAGAPATLNVTALRREEAAEPAPPEPAPPESVTPESVTPTPEAPAPGTATDPAATPATTPAATPGAIATTALGATPSAPPASTAPVAAAVAPVAPSTLERPYIQLGIFSVEANASALVADMTARGLPARIARSTVQDRPFWRVLVGPAGSEAQRAAYLDQVKAQGFADAYFVRN
ncbi:MAG: SPOR domain-containing protein [Rubellimicrobium sp.]|nr:SPOR domain-containing protein [Rubellimicrobium sp.]